MRGNQDKGKWRHIRDGRQWRHFENRVPTGLISPKKLTPLFTENKRDLPQNKAYLWYGCHKIKPICGIGATKSGAFCHIKIALKI